MKISTFDWLAHFTIDRNRLKFKLFNPVWNDRPIQATIYSTLVGRGYQEEWGMGNAE